MTFPGLFSLPKTPFVLGANQSHVYPNKCAKFGCGRTVVSRGEHAHTATHTDKGTLQLVVGVLVKHRIYLDSFL